MYAVLKRAKHIPVIGPMLRDMRNTVADFVESKQLQSKSAEQIFTTYYETNRWNDEYSRSGPGSNLVMTNEFRPRLPEVWRSLGVNSILDVPCGDFRWMKEVDLRGFDYTGADIVGQIVADNRRQYSRAGIDFRRINLIADALPPADLVFCRDCLVHLSLADVTRALANIKRSGATWLMTTHFPQTQFNADIVTGQWRPLNFEQAPFGFAPPELVIVEKSDPSLEWPDKSLAVWRISALPEIDPA